MGHQGHLLTKKREHLSRKQDNNLQVANTDHFDSGYNYVSFKSRESTFNGILEGLQDDKISCVALYGMSGTGKTTLAKYIGKKAKELNIFNTVLFVFVRYPPRVKKIQGDIADQLGLTLGEEDDLAARQRRISLSLRNEGLVLIILDNIWERLHLREIGISNDGSSHTHTGCKVLLTTRSQQVAYLMGCQLNFPLYLLADEEAFWLFRKHVSIYDGSSPDLIVLAKKVAECCQGLPLKISVIGSALRGKTVDQWRKLLGTSPEYNSSLTVFPSLLLSYNAISSKVAKTLFLIYGLFPKGHEILIEDLSHYAIRLGLCSKNEASAAINALKDSCLLMHSDKSKDCVKMHDLVHEMAVTMVYSENLTYADSINEYIGALFHEEDFQWHEELDRLLGRLYGVREYPSSSTSNSTPFYAGGGEGHELQVVLSYSYTMASAILKPSGKLADFYGLCKVDKSFLPLLKDACAMKPQLIESQRRHSEMLRQSAFECLGRVLFLLHNVRKRDWMYHKDELEIFWEQLKVMKFDLDWLSPVVEGAFSSAEILRIEALQEEEKYWNQEAAKLREQLMIVENKAEVVRTEITLTESKLDGLAIAEASKIQTN